MKKEIVQYATGKFKHFDGKEREFTVCMASNATSLLTDSDDAIAIWERYLLFGVSVRNPKDAPNESLAKKIAYGKAHSSKGRTVAFDDLALMSSSVAKAILDNFVKRIENDPSLVIDNYDIQKEAYLKKCKKLVD